MGMCIMAQPIKSSYEKALEFNNNKFDDSDTKNREQLISANFKTGKFKIGNQPFTVKTPGGFIVVLHNAIDSLKRQFLLEDIRNGQIALAVNQKALTDRDFNTMGSLYFLEDVHINDLYATTTDRFVEILKDQISFSRLNNQIDITPVGDAHYFSNKAVRFDTKVKGIQNFNQQTDYYRSYIFVPAKEGGLLWIVDSKIDPEKNSKALDDFAISIIFDKGNHYQDYVYDNRTTATTQNIETLIEGSFNKDNPNIDYETNVNEEKNQKEKDSIEIIKAGEIAWSFICYIGFIWFFIGFGSLVCIFLLSALVLYLCMLANPNKRKTGESDKKFMRRASANLKARIGIYFAFYGALLTLSMAWIVFLIYGSIFLIIAIIKGWFVFLVMGSVLSIFIDTFLFFTYCGIWITSIMVVKSLLNPIINFKRSFNNEGANIKRNEAPELWQLIDEVSKECGVNPPKELFILSGPNARASFIDPLKSIRGGGERSLSIGLPLFSLLTVQELKAVIAHEFGHFAQDETRQSVAAWYASSMIWQVLDGTKTQNDRIAGLLTHENKYYRWWGRFTVFVLNKIKKGLFKLFRFVTFANNEMTRCMELDADKVSARVAGSEAAVSVLYKFWRIAYIDDNFASLLQIFINNHGAMPYNTIDCFMMLLSSLQTNKNYVISSDRLIFKPLGDNAKSRVEYLNQWNTHPDDDIRIEIIKKENCKVENYNLTSSWNLISHLSKILNDSLYSNLDPEIKRIDNKKFIEWLKKDFEERTFPEDLELFFNREVLFDSNDVELEAEALSDDELEDMRKICKEYISAASDLETIMTFKYNKIDTNEIIYNGIPYNRKNVPVDLHQLICIDLGNKVKEIDRKIIRHAKAIHNDNDEVMYHYYNLLYVQDISISLSKKFDDEIEKIKRFYKIPELVEPYRAQMITEHINNLINEFRKFIKDSIDIRRHVNVMHIDTYNWLKTFVNNNEPMYSIKDIEIVNNFFIAVEYIKYSLNDIGYYSKKCITAIICRTEIPGPWKDSIAETLH